MELDGQADYDDEKSLLMYGCCRNEFPARVCVRYLARGTEKPGWRFG